MFGCSKFSCSTFSRSTLIISTFSHSCSVVQRSVVSAFSRSTFNRSTSVDRRSVGESNLLLRRSCYLYFLMLLYLILSFIYISLYIFPLSSFSFKIFPFSSPRFFILFPPKITSAVISPGRERGGGAYVDTRAFLKTNVNCLFSYKCRTVSRWVGVCCSCVTWVKWCLDCFGRWRTVYNVAGGPGWAVVPSV